MAKVQSKHAVRAQVHAWRAANLSWSVWRSDGTDDGTVMVKDINPGAGPSEPRGFVVMGETLYFTAQDNPHGRERANE